MKQNESLLNFLVKNFELSSKDLDMEIIRNQIPKTYIGEFATWAGEVNSIMFKSSQYILQHNILSLYLEVNKNLNEDFKKAWEKLCETISVSSNKYELSTKKNLTMITNGRLLVLLEMKQGKFFSLSITIGRI